MLKFCLVVKFTKFFSISIVEMNAVGSSKLQRPVSQALFCCKVSCHFFLQHVLIFIAQFRALCFSLFAELQKVSLHLGQGWCSVPVVQFPLLGNKSFLKCLFVKDISKANWKEKDVSFSFVSSLHFLIRWSWFTFWLFSLFLLLWIISAWFLIPTDFDSYLSAGYVILEPWQRSWLHKAGAYNPTLWAS